MSPEASLDAADMAALQAGEEEALNRLMERNAEKVYHFLLRILSNQAEAADLSQETFVRVYLNRDKFETGKKVTTWIYAIATNLARDHLRRGKRRPTVSLDEGFSEEDYSPPEKLADPALQPNEMLLAGERAEAVRQAVKELPEELKTPLVLAEYENLSHAEIAGILKCTPKAIETRIYRARKLLLKPLQKFLQIV